MDAFPHLSMNQSFRLEMDRVHWQDNPQHFSAWCDGLTGYPIVDAAMRGLQKTGWMHKRLRMIVASFLTKDIQIDWREGERTPAEHRASMTWVQRLKRVYGIDIETCPTYGGTVKVIACIEDALVIQRILNHLKEKGEYQDALRLPECRGPRQTSLFGLGKFVSESQGCCRRHQALDWLI
jgi:deoxyribodipyrimidine photolyase